MNSSDENITRALVAFNDECIRPQTCEPSAVCGQTVCILRREQSFYPICPFDVQLNVNFRMKWNKHTSVFESNLNVKCIVILGFFRLLPGWFLFLEFVNLKDNCCRTETLHCQYSLSSRILWISTNIPKRYCEITRIFLMYILLSGDLSVNMNALKRSRIKPGFITFICFI